MIRLTAKERILLHLFDYAKYADAVEVPPGITQEGIAQASGIDVPHFTQYVRPLVREGLVRERMAHVKDVRRRRKVYDLTDTGKLSAVRLRDKLRSEVVRVRDERGVHEATVSQVVDQTAGKASILDVVRTAMDDGIVDLASLVPVPRTSFVEMLSGAPRIDVFVGRRAELDVITSEGEAPRLFVVRGVAGIGKSSLGAKAAELFRGKWNIFWHRTRPWDTISSILAGVGDFLSALGRPGLRSVLSRGETSRGAEILREDLTGTKAFLVFDDAHEAGEESIAFLRVLKEAVENAPDARALVLTRRSLHFYDRRDVVLTGLVAEIDLQGLNSQDVAALVSSEPDAPRLAELGRWLGGHPLFLELIKAQHPPSTKTMRDVHRFIKEEIYDKLTGDERSAMKTASLYEVPVPPHALLSRADLSHDVIFALADRSLLRLVGDDRFEVHDTIRDFLQSLVTPSESQSLGAFAGRELHRLALEAQENGNFVGSVNCLSNALRLMPDPRERAILSELLGDANLRVADLQGAFAAFREALKVDTDRNVQARVHRKIALALLERGEIAAASREVADARRALGDSSDVERGWLHFVECSIASQQEDWEIAREHGKAALDIFRTFKEPRGLVESLLQFELIETHSPNADPGLAVPHLNEAAELSKSIGDSELTARLHSTLFHFFAYHRSGHKERAAAHIGMLFNARVGPGDPTVQAYSTMAPAWFDLDFRADYPLAETQFSEGMVAARKIYDASLFADARGGLALLSLYHGRIDEARRGFEQCVDDMTRLGLGYFRGSARTPGRLSFTGLMWMIAECSLMQGDFKGFKRIVTSLEDPEHRRRWESVPVLEKVLRGVDLLLEADVQGSLKVLDEAVQMAERGFVVQESPFVNWPHLAHLLYGIVLRGLGKEEEAADHIRQARQILQTCNLLSLLSFIPEEERRLTEGLRKADIPR